MAGPPDLDSTQSLTFMYPAGEKHNLGGEACERCGDVVAAHRQAAKHDRVHLQRQRRGIRCARVFVHDLERRRHRRHHRGSVRQRDVGGGAVELHLPVIRLVAEARVDMLEDVRRGLALEVLMQPGALASGWAARLVVGPAAAT